MRDQKVQSYLPPLFLENDRLEKIRSYVSEIDALYKDYAEKNHLPGYAYGILLDGQLVHSGSGGFIDLEKKNPATPQSMFRIASITKSFTASAILKLRDEGKLSLDDRVDLYIPEIKKQNLTTDAPEITIRDLLTHSAGFATDNPWADRKLDQSEKVFLALLKKGILFSNSPQMNFEYSNLGYILLGYVVKKITGRPCEEYILTEICHPIGMKEVAWEYSQVPESQLAHGYSWLEDRWEEENLLHEGAGGPMGGMITSVESFSRYVAYHQAAWPPRDEAEWGPVKRSSIREMHRPWNFIKLMTDFKYADGEECAMVNAYGYGSQLGRDSHGKVFAGHSGGLPGFGCNWFIMPDYGLGSILFTNLTYAPAYKLNLSVLDKLITDLHLKRRQLPPSKILRERQGDLLKLLPHWENARESSAFSDNFFLDRSVDSLKKESTQLFLKAGKIVSIGELIAESQLSGHFTLEGEKANLYISFGLTSENPSLIQCYQIREIVKGELPKGR